jgi:serine/threonine-protein kinase
VDSVALSQSTCKGTDGMQALVTVRSDGAAAGTLTLTWFHSTTPDRRGAVVVATVPVTLAAGQETLSTTYAHVFGASDPYPYWGLAVSTDPAAASGQDSAELVDGTSCGTVIF